MTQQERAANLEKRATQRACILAKDTPEHSLLVQRLRVIEAEELISEDDLPWSIRPIMQSRIRFLIKHTQYEAYLNRLANGHVTNLFHALWFGSKEQAEAWMDCEHAPSDRENYKIVETKTIIEEVEE